MIRMSRLVRAFDALARLSPAEFDVLETANPNIEAFTKGYMSGKTAKGKGVQQEEEKDKNKDTDYGQGYWQGYKGPHKNKKPASAALAGTKPYYMLFTCEKDGKWSPQFGDYTRSDVEEEDRNTYAKDYPRNKRKIVRLANDTQAAVKAAENNLNKGS